MNIKILYQVFLISIILCISDISNGQKITYQITLPDSFKAEIPVILAHYQNATHQIIEELTITDTAIDYMKDTGKVILYPRMHARSKMILIDRNYLPYYSVLSFTEDITHELFHTFRGETPALLDSVIILDSIHSIKGYIGLTPLFTNGLCYRGIEESSAEIVCWIINPKYRQCNSYRNVTLLLYHIVKQQWINPEELLGAQINSDFPLVAARIVNKPKENLTAADIKFVLVLFSDAERGLIDYGRLNQYRSVQQ